MRCLARIVAVVAVLGCTAGAPATSSCPSGTTLTNEAWAPVAWREPVKLCTCATNLHCRGPYCREPPGDPAFLLGCSSCACLPTCADPFDCWREDCICPHAVTAAIPLRDPLLPHSPAQVQAALKESFPTGVPQPSKFDRRYKNPCWEDDGGNLKCLPAFYIPGILKCATSALYDVLAKHQSVKPSYPKETHWWTRNRLPINPAKGIALQDSRWLQNHARAVKNNADKGKDIVILEGSASMFWETPYGGVMVPELVHAIQPGVKFVLMIRDPAERLYSDYIYFSYRTLFNKNPATKQYKYNPEGFHLAVQQSLKEVRRCLEAHPSRFCAWEQRRYRPVTQIQLGMYSEFLETWLRYFPAKQFLVVRKEDLSVEPRAFFNKVTDFLELDRLSDTQLFGPGGEKVKQSNVRSGGRKGMLDKTRVLLDEFYAPYNKKLAAMVGNPILDYTAAHT